MRNFFTFRGAVLFQEAPQIIRPYRVRLSVGAILLAVSVVAQLAYPQIVATLFDRSIRGWNAEWAASRMTMLAIVMVVQAAAAAGESYLFSSAGTLIVFRVRALLFAAILKQEIGFFDGQSVGELMNRLSSDAEQLRTALSRSPVDLVHSFLLSIGCVFLMIKLSPLLSLVVVLAAPPVVFATRWIGRKTSDLSATRQQGLAECAHVAQEVLSNIRLVHAYEQTRYEQDRYGKSANLATAMSLKCNRLFTGLSSIHSLLSSAALLATLWVGLALVGAHQLTAGSLTSFLIYAMMLVNAMTTMSALTNDWMQAAGGTRRVFEVMRRRPSIAPRPTKSVPRLLGHIEFDRVNFSYPERPHQLALRDLSLSIAAGEKVALVGPSGAGKSTIMSLILGYYRPLSGVIRFDGIPAEELSLYELRKHLAIVEQEPMLFAGTIAENIRYGTTLGSAAEADIVEAAIHANVHEFVLKLPLGYETQVGNRGLQLSGGQKQRIAIARALLRNPRVLLLDEPTSALDSENEDKVQSALQNLMKERTTIMISHRPSLVAYADRRVTISDGRASEHDASLWVPEPATALAISR